MTDIVALQKACYYVVILCHSGEIRMGIGMVDLKRIEQNYPDSYNHAFEDMVTHMFMVKLKLLEPPLRRKNQRAIESDPVIVEKDIDDVYKAGIYAFQAKYYEPNKEIRDKKEEFITAIHDACNPYVTGGVKVSHLIFYVNKQLTQNPTTGKKPEYQVAIENEANKNGIKIHWYTQDKIEADLVKIEYNYIREMFLCNQNMHDISGFYQYNCKKIINDSDTELYGKMPLNEGYIELSIFDRMGEGQWSKFAKRKIGHNQSIREYLESWVMEEEFITIICGEPGHGKTSLCRKAMYDFYKIGWLENKVRNIFCISINPVGTKVFDDLRLDVLDSLLSWENDDGSREEARHKLSREDCKNALIFLDGYDELLECLPQLSMERFLNRVIKFQKHFDVSTRPHIVITTRKMAISHSTNTKAYYLNGGNIVRIKELSFITEEQQYEWIQKHENYLRNIKLRDFNSRAMQEFEQNKEKLYEDAYQKINSADSWSYLDKYRKMYRGLESNDELKNILGVPIIFRMIVVAGIMNGYMPESGSHLTTIYTNLLEITWNRHNVERNDTQGNPVDLEYIKRKLTRHALKVYVDNGDSAETSEEIGSEESSWLYAFYTKHKGDAKTKRDSRAIRVGFLHKSFYEYFLACEIISWFQSYTENCKLLIDGKDVVDFKDVLSILGRQKLSDEVLCAIADLYEAKKKSYGESDDIDTSAFDTAYRILKETDGILSMPIDEKYQECSKSNALKNFFREIVYLYENSNNLTPLINAENVFWNVVSICGVCGHSIKKDSINAYAIQRYNLAKCRLNHANFESVHMEGAHLEGAYLEGANLTNANLTGAFLQGANLIGASMKGANLANALLDEAHLSWASIEDSMPRNAQLEGAFLDFGRYQQGENGEILPLTWRILQMQGTGQALLITEKLIERKPYHDARKRVSWDFCKLNNWLNSDFLGTAFYPNELERILTSRNQGVDELNDTKIRNMIFVLSVTAAEILFRKDNERIATLTPYALKTHKDRYTHLLPSGEMSGWWWLSSSNDSNIAAIGSSPNLCVNNL